MTNSAQPVSQSGVRDGARSVLIICVMIATLMQALDTTIANVALPYMQGSLAATSDQISWVLTSYIVAAAIMTSPVGWLSLRYGRRAVFLTSVAGFTLASILCGVAATIDQMVVFRLLQGVFGAALIPLSQAILLDTFPKNEQAKAVAMWGLAVTIGPILGPTLGGYFTEYFNWRLVFFINVPLGLLSFTGLWFLLRDPDGSPKAPLFDWRGFFFLSCAIGAFQMMLDRGELVGWFESSEIMIEAGIAAVMMYLFIIHIFTWSKPFIDRTLFADRNFAVGCILMFIVYGTMMSILSLMTPFLQTLSGYPVLTAGILMAPLGAGTMVAMLTVSRLLKRFTPRSVILVGLVFLLYAVSMMRGFTPDVSVSSIVMAGALEGVGVGLIVVPLTALAFATLAPTQRTAAASVITLLRNIGGAIGISAMNFLISRNEQIVHEHLVQHVTAVNPLFRFNAMATYWNPTTQAGLSALNDEIDRQAAIISFNNDFHLLMMLVMAIFPMLLVLKAPKAGKK